MNALRWALAAAMLLGLLSAAQGQGKVKKKDRLDLSKLVGTWEPIEKDRASGTLIQFTRDKKIRITQGKTLLARGTYTITGDIVATELEFDDGDTKKGNLRIRSVNDRELLVADLDRKGRIDRLERRK